jgi:hypothetical protein
MSERIDDEAGSRLLFDAVRGSIRAHGGDTTEAPFDRLDEPSRAVWLAAWRALISELMRRDYIFANYSTVRSMAEGEPISALWRALETKAGYGKAADDGE